MWKAQTPRWLRHSWQFQKEVPLSAGPLSLFVLNAYSHCHASIKFITLKRHMMALVFSYGQPRYILCIRFLFWVDHVLFHTGINTDGRPMLPAKPCSKLALKAADPERSPFTAPTIVHEVALGIVSHEAGPFIRRSIRLLDDLALRFVPYDVQRVRRDQVGSRPKHAAMQMRGTGIEVIRGRRGIVMLRELIHRHPSAKLERDGTMLNRDSQRKNIRRAFEGLGDRPHQIIGCAGFDVDADMLHQMIGKLLGRQKIDAPIAYRSPVDAFRGIEAEIERIGTFPHLPQDLPLRVRVDPWPCVFSRGFLFTQGIIKRGPLSPLARTFQPWFHKRYSRIRSHNSTIPLLPRGQTVRYGFPRLIPDTSVR